MLQIRPNPLILVELFPFQNNNSFIVLVNLVENAREMEKEIRSHTSKRGPREMCAIYRYLLMLL